VTPGRIEVPYPWTVTVGLARTGIAAATLATLAATPTDSMFRPLRGPVDAPDCEGLAAIGLFCVSGSAGREVARWLAVAAMAVVASGWRPRLTAIPHWWLAFSVFHGLATPDGGDQIVSIVTLALIPHSLLDPRRWHWDRCTVDVSGRRAAVAASAIVAVKVQASFLYFQASVAKLSHPEWADGTAIYYYLTAPNLGADDWLRGPLSLAFAAGPVVAALTWTPLAIELALALTLLTRRGARMWLFVVGALFHGAIGLAMGLWSFSAIMVSVLLILTVPVGAELRRNRGSRPLDGLSPATAEAVGR
jgi:antimicrobial peptide system SdpB family protein